MALIRCSGGSGGSSECVIVFNGIYVHDGSTGIKAPQTYNANTEYCILSSKKIIIQKSGKYTIRVLLHDTQNKTQQLYIDGNVNTLSPSVENVYSEISLSANDEVYFYRNNTAGNTYYSIVVEYVG